MTDTSRDGIEALAVIYDNGGDCDPKCRYRAHGCPCTVTAGTLRTLNAERDRLRQDVRDWAGIRDELVAERDALLGRLRLIAKPKYGLQSIMEEHSDTNAFNYHAMQYWASLAQSYEGIARAALSASRAVEPPHEAKLDALMGRDGLGELRREIDEQWGRE